MPQPVTLSVLLLLLLLGGCASVGERSAGGGELLLLPPSQGPGAMLLKQKVTFEAKGERFRFLALTRFETSRIKSVMLLPEGQPLVSLAYDGNRLIRDNRTPVEIPVREVLSIMQFSLWPEPAVREHYAPSDGWVLGFSPDRRTLDTPGGPVLEVRYEAGGLVVNNYRHGYRITVETLEKQVL